MIEKVMTTIMIFTLFAMEAMLLTWISSFIFEAFVSIRAGEIVFTAGTVFSAIFAGYFAFPFAFECEKH